MDVYNCSAVRIINKHGKKNATRSVRKAPFDFGMLLSVFRISVPAAVMVFLFLCAPHTIFAAPSRQNSQTAKETQSTEEDIQIPDVSTTIEGGTSSLDSQAVPDFTLILPQADPDYLLSVKLPETADSTAGAASSASSFKTSNLGLEGVIGAGFPGFFVGKFSLFQNTGKHPFGIRFSHTAQNGLGSYSASDGYNKTDTALSADGRFLFSGERELAFAFGYDTSTDGLQKQSPLFYNTSRQSVDGSVFFTAALPSDWEASVGAQTVHAKRFPGYIASVPAGADVSAHSVFGDFQTGFHWKPHFLTLGFDGSYRWLFVQADQTDDKKIINRGSFYTDISGTVKEKWTLGASAGFVFADNIKLPILVPFSLNLMYKKPELTIKTSGGMRTVQSDFAALYKRYPFVHFGADAAEQADWFAEVEAAFPFAQTFAFNGGISFSKTAFSHGALLPDYGSKHILSGLYTSHTKDLLRLDTNTEISSQFGIWGIAASWKGSWLDVIPGEDIHAIGVSGTISPEKGKWGAQAGITECFGIDYTPVLSASAYYRFVPEFRIELELKDMIKLFSGGVRRKAGDFITDSGTVALFAKLFL